MPTDSIEVDVFLRYQADSDVGNIADSCPESYILSVTTDILGTAQLPGPAACGDNVLLGELTFHVVRVGNVINDENNLYDVFDCHAETAEAAAAIFNASCTDYRAAIGRGFEEAALGGDILLLRRLRIAPVARGQRLGLSVLERVVRDWSSGCALVVLKPFPLQFESHARKGRDWERLDLGSFTQSKGAATAKLAAYYSTLGFARIGRSPFHALCPMERLPNARDLDLPEGIALYSRALAELLKSVG